MSIFRPSVIIHLDVVGSFPIFVLKYLRKIQFRFLITSGLFDLHMKTISSDFIFLDIIDNDSRRIEYIGDAFKVNFHNIYHFVKSFFHYILQKNVFIADYIVCILHLFSHHLAHWLVVDFSLKVTVHFMKKFYISYCKFYIKIYLRKCLLNAIIRSVSNEYFANVHILLSICIGYHSLYISMFAPHFS